MNWESLSSGKSCKMSPFNGTGVCDVWEMLIGCRRHYVRLPLLVYYVHPQFPHTANF